MFKDAVINYLEEQEDKTILDSFKKDFVYLFNLDDFQIFWMNKTYISIEDLFENLRKNPQESISTIIDKLSNKNYKIPEWDNVVDTIIPCKLES